MQFLRVISQQLSRFTALVIILAAAVTFIEPATFSWVTGDTQIIVLGAPLSRSFSMSGAPAGRAG